MKKLVAIHMVLFAFLITACFKDVHKSILKTADTNNNKVEIRHMSSGCCGCETVYVNSYRGKRIEEQFISEFSCGFGEPTKFLFHYDQSGKMAIANRLIAVYDTSYITPVTIFEKNVFKQLDSIEGGKVNPVSRRHYSEITGFRTPKENEKLHPFAYDKKNKTIYPK